jgi:hypothetical protein
VSVVTFELTVYDKSIAKEWLYDFLNRFPETVTPVALTARYCLRRTVKKSPLPDTARTYWYDDPTRAAVLVKCPEFNKKTCDSHCKLMAHFGDKSLVTTFQCKCGATFIYSENGQTTTLPVFDQHPNEEDLGTEFIRRCNEKKKSVENPFTVCVRRESTAETLNLGFNDFLNFVFSTSKA